MQQIILSLAPLQYCGRNLKYIFIFIFLFGYFPKLQAQNWNQIVKSVAPDRANLAYYGKSVSVSGNYAVVGAQGNTSNTNSEGVAYILKKDTNGIWTDVKTLQASVPTSSAWFGDAVSISGDYVIVGAWGENGQKGAAYIFKKDQGGTDNWGLVTQIVASDGAFADFFGRAVSISGDYAIVGAGRHDSSAGAYL